MMEMEQDPKCVYDQEQQAP
uniref:Uncharacterized protein n=1 Tax=Arundo donax TaxID=35708 RepID=A0A0A9BFZ7_ARUDO